MARKARPISERMVGRYQADDSTGCWNWSSYVNPNGYGIVMVAGKPRRAHRIMYELRVGPIPPGLDLDHLCRNRRCCNPAHLEPVTRKVNLNRSPTACKAGGVTTARILKARTHCRRGHEYTEENTDLVYGKWRRCRTCQREHFRRSYARKKTQDAAA